MPDDDIAHDFWEMAEPFLARDGVDTGTMFGFPCVRLNGVFVAMPSHTERAMIVKLPASDVTELIDEGAGQPVAPSGRTFKEWVYVADTNLWPALFEQALAFAAE